MNKVAARVFCIGGLCLLSALALSGCGGGGDSATTAAFSIGGNPATQAAIGQAYSFTPVVTDANAGAVGFSIQNKPMWATFNTTTGQLQGTPSSSDVGSYPGITISASTGGSEASLAAFTITVLQHGSVLLNWQAPTQNTDGSPLADVVSYTIHYGTIASLLTQSATVDSPATSYALDNLGSGVWYFAISANSSAGVEGAWSDVVSTTLN